MVFGIIMLIKGNESFVIRKPANIRKNNAKETTEKQVVEQTEDVKTGITRKTAADELSYLSKKFDSDAVWIRYQC